MQIGEGRARAGDPLVRTLTTLKGVAYRILYCPACATLHREVVDLDGAPTRSEGQ